MKSVMAGERATIGTLSFFPSKNLGAYGDGGMMLTQDGGLATRLKRLRVHGGARTYFHDEVGYNSRLDALIQYLGERQPDVVCLQELKAPQDKFPLQAIQDAG